MHHEVIHIDNEPTFHEVISEDMVHEHLKGRRRVALAKEHNFVKPIRSSESSLPLVSLLNPNIVIPLPDIKFGEVPRVFESVDKVRDTRKRVSILDCMRIHISVVLAGVERSILLWDEEEWGRLRGLRRKDLFFFEILIDEHL